MVLLLFQDRSNYSICVRNLALNPRVNVERDEAFLSRRTLHDICLVHFMYCQDLLPLSRVTMTNPPAPLRSRYTEGSEGGSCPTVPPAMAWRHRGRSIKRFWQPGSWSAHLSVEHLPRPSAPECP